MGQGFLPLAQLPFGAEQFFVKGRGRRAALVHQGSLASLASPLLDAGAPFPGVTIEKAPNIAESLLGFHSQLRTTGLGRGCNISEEN